MSTKYFIAIHLPKELEDKIIELQKINPNNNLPYKLKPHITIKSPIGLTEALDWIGNIKNVCNIFKPFEVSTSIPNLFGEDVLYLSVISEKIKELHRNLVNTFSYSKEEQIKFFELDLYSPHISLGLTWEGLSKEELLDLQILFTKELQTYSFNVKSIFILQKEKDKWEEMIEIQLLG
jgi:2'-5' RNA ligase